MLQTTLARISLLIFVGAGGALAQTSAPATAPATRAAPPVYDSPMAACIAYCKLTLQAEPDALANVCIVSDPKFQSAWEAMDNSALAHRRLEREVALHFPKGDIELMDGWTMEKCMTSILNRLPKAKITTSKDEQSATVAYPDEADPNYPKAEPFRCIHVGAGWKIDAILTETLAADSLPLTAPLQKERAGLDKLTTDIAAGKIATLAEVKKQYELVQDSSHP